MDDQSLLARDAARQPDGATDDALSVHAAAELAALTRQIEREEAKARDASAATRPGPDDTLEDAYRAGELVGRAQGLALAALLARRVLEAVEREAAS